MTMQLRSQKRYLFANVKASEEQKTGLSPGCICHKFSVLNDKFVFLFRKGTPFLLLLF